MEIAAYQLEFQAHYEMHSLAQQPRRMNHIQRAVHGV
jgi:hypothetical protein